MPITEDIQSLAPEARITLWRIEMPEEGIDQGFTSSASSTIQFDGVDYDPLPIEGKGFGQDSKSPPRPTIAVSNVGSLYTAALFQFNNLLGAKITRFETFKKYLDGEAAADPTQKLPDRIYYINRKVRHDREAVEFELISGLDGTRRQVPSRIIGRKCDLIYRTWDPDEEEFVYSSVEPCPYSGTSYFDDNDNISTQANDCCSKTPDGCAKRFGANAQLPFRGFPGAAR